MPTYSYRCSACGHTFDKVQRITEDALKTCESCGEDKAGRLITSGNFMLKGSGWYGDLYSGNSNKKAEASTESAPSTASAPAGAAAPATAAAATPAAPAAAPASTPSSSST
jgi:putative FmdB family regulatory protein